MKKQLLTGLFGLLALTASAQTFQEWKDPRINAIHRAPMHTNYFAYESMELARKGIKQAESGSDHQQTFDFRYGQRDIRSFRRRKKQTARQNCD